MSKTTKLCLILLPISVLMLVFCVSVVEARGGSFVIGLMHEAVENVNLRVSDQVFGNLSASDGCIDFFISNPDGVTVQDFLNISNISFNFTADVDGNYSMHMNNMYQAHDVTVELEYGVHMTITSQVNMNVGISSGFAQVVPPRFEQPDKPDEPDNLVEKYLNFLKATDILKTATNARTILPIRSVNLMSCITAVVGLTMVISMREREPDVHKYMRSIRRFVENGKVSSWQKQLQQ